MPMQLNVVTIEREVYSADDVDMVNVPGIEGVMGILPRHSPVVTALGQGDLEIIRGEEREHLAIGGGFMQVRNSEVVIMADAAEKADEIDEDRAQQARQRAKQALDEAGDRVDMEKALAALRRAEVRLKVAKRGRRRREGPSSQ